jgi:SAM-dependent methyltransferase
VLAPGRELRKEARVGAPSLDRLSATLTKDPSGIWTVRGVAPEKVSFPDAFYQACFEIEDHSFWFAHRSECIFRALARHPFEGPLIDVGGGNGAVSAALQRRGVRSILLEPGEDGARNAVRRGLPDVVCATLEQAGFAPGSFSAAGLFDVVEHVADDVGILRAVHRVLRPAGILCLTVPAYPWLWAAEDEQAGHHRRYTLASLRRVLGEAGFAARYETYMFAPLVAPIFLLRSLRHRFLPRSEAAVNEAATRQHTPSLLARRALDAILRPEARWIAGGRKVPIGTSCLVVAIAEPSS